MKLYVYCSVIDIGIPISVQLRRISANHNIDYILLSNGTTWLPVCNYNWEVAESMVTCRQLGYIGSKQKESQYGNYMTFNVLLLWHGGKRFYNVALCYDILSKSAHLKLIILKIVY